MNADESERFTNAIFELDPEAAIDTVGPPNHTPFSVIFSGQAKLNNRDLENLSGWLQKLEYLNIGQTSVSGEGISHLTNSLSLKIVTIPFGLPTQTITDLFVIPTLRRIKICLPDTVLDNYRHLPDEFYMSDHITIFRRSDRPTPLKELYPNVWDQIN